MKWNKNAPSRIENSSKKFNRIREHSRADLNALIEKKFYSTPEVASCFDITDATSLTTLNHLKNISWKAKNPTTATVIRLDFKSILI